MNAVTAPLNPCNGPPPENVEPAEAAADATLAEVRVEPAALPELPRASAASTVLATLAVVAALGWGQRFLVPVTAGLMLAMLVMPVNAWLSHALRSRALATLTTLLLVMGALAAGAAAFGGQLLRVAERAPEMISMVAQQLALRDPGTGVLLVSNTLVGVAVWVAFAVSGLPDAAGWGVTAAVLHVVPYLGMALLTGLGAAESFLVHGTLASALSMAAFLVLLSTIAGTLVTAWLQGRAAKMNSAAVFIGLVFWGALWGVWGLFLGPALVVLLKVIAEHSRSGQRLARLMQG